MFQKVNFFVDSALKRRMSANTEDGRCLMTEPGIWEIMRLIPTLLELGYAWKPYNGPHDLGVLEDHDSKGFCEFCEYVRNARRVEATIRMNGSGVTYFTEVRLIPDKRSSSQHGLLAFRTYLVDGATELMALA